MRVSTTQIFSSGTLGLLRNQSSLYKLQNQMSTGRRILAPEDDPIGASEALNVTQSMSINSQFLENQSNASSQLTLVEDRLNGVVSLIQDVKARLVQAGNGSLTDSDRAAMAAEIRQRYDEALSWPTVRTVPASTCSRDSRGRPSPLPWRACPAAAP